MLALITKKIVDFLPIPSMPIRLLANYLLENFETFQYMSYLLYSIYC